MSELEQYIEDTFDGRTLTLTAASDVTPANVWWAWHGRVPLGALTILAGREGLGKSTLMARIAAKISTGTLDGDLKGIPSPVLMCSLEDAVAQVLVPRLTAACADLSEVSFVELTDGGHADTLVLPDDVDRLAEAAASVGARLLVVDPLSATLSSETNSHNEASVRRVLSALAGLAENAEMAVLVVMHLNKGTGGFLTRINGSRGFTAAARSVLGFGLDKERGEDEKENPYRVCVHGKSNYGRLAPALSYELAGATVGEGISTSRLTFVGECDATASDLVRNEEPVGPGETEIAEEWLQDELGDGEWHPSRQLYEAAKRADIRDRTLRRAAKTLGVEMERSGFPATSKWRLPQSGQAPSGSTNGQTVASTQIQ